MPRTIEIKPIKHVKNALRLQVQHNYMNNAEADTSNKHKEYANSKNLKTVKTLTHSR